MNSVAILLNNRAVSELQNGNIVQAFELLSKAANITLSGIANHSHVDVIRSNIRFHWEDCAKAGSNLRTDSESSTEVMWEGSVSFLCLRALRITYSGTSDDVDSQCACAFAWSIWFNFALACTIIGTRMGERGLHLLEAAFDLYHKVQKRIDNEPTQSKHWDLLEMAVLNNTACIYRDFAMFGEMALHLEELESVLLNSNAVDYRQKTSFILTLQILGTSAAAPSA